LVLPEQQNPGDSFPVDRRRWLSAAGSILLVLVLLAVFAQRWHVLRAPRLDDFLLNWVTARYVSTTHQGDVYTPQGEEAVHAFAIPYATDDVDSAMLAGFAVTQTPFWHSLIGIFSTGRLEVDSLLFNALSMMALSAAAVFFFRRLGYRLAGTLLMGIFLLLFFAPLLSDWSNSNLSRLLLGVLAAGLAGLATGVAPARFLAGAILGLGVMLKPTIVLVPVFLGLSRLIRRQWRLLVMEGAGTLVGMLAGILLAAVFFGSWMCWPEWLSRIWLLPPEKAPLSSWNFSLPMLGKAVLGIDVSIPILIMGLSFSLFLVWRMAGKGDPFRQDAGPMILTRIDFLRDLRMAALGCIAFLFCSSLTWEHYFLLTLPMVFLVFNPAWQRSRGMTWRLVSWGSLAMVALNPITDIHPVPQFGEALLSWGGTLGILVCGLTGDLSQVDGG
jgi:hypothetical protein